MKARLYGIPGSHNAAIAEAMLRHTGITYTRRDLIPGAHRHAPTALREHHVECPACSGTMRIAFDLDVPPPDDEPVMVDLQTEPERALRPTLRRRAEMRGRRPRIEREGVVPSSGRQRG